MRHTGRPPAEGLIQQLFRFCVLSALTEGTEIITATIEILSATPAYFLSLAYWFRHHNTSLEAKILARIVLKPIERIVVSIALEILRCLVIHFTEKHHEIDMLITYVAQGQILACNLSKPVANTVMLIVLASWRTGTPTIHRDIETLNHPFRREAWET